MSRQNVEIVRLATEPHNGEEMVPVIREASSASPIGPIQMRSWLHGGRTPMFGRCTPKLNGTQAPSEFSGSLTASTGLPSSGPVAPTASLGDPGAVVHVASLLTRIFSSWNAGDAGIDCRRGRGPERFAIAAAPPVALARRPVMRSPPQLVGILWVGETASSALLNSRKTLPLTGLF
jgi:hypothetical protein